jgi:hypothetical protein
MPEQQSPDSRQDPKLPAQSLRHVPSKQVPLQHGVPELQALPASAQALH